MSRQGRERDHPNGELMDGMAGTSAHLIVGEDDVHAPMETILDVPVLADGGGEAEGVRGKTGETGDVETSFDGGLAFDGAGGFDHGEGFQAGPAFGLAQTER